MAGTKATKKVGKKAKTKQLTGEEAPQPAPPSSDQGDRAQFISEQHFRHMLYGHLVDIEEKLTAINEQIGEFQKTMSDVQSQINAIVTELTTIASDLEAEWQALKSQVAAGQTVDLSGLESIVGRLNSDDAAWKQPAPPPPATT